MLKVYALIICFLLIGCAHEKKLTSDVVFPYSTDLLKDIQTIERFPASLEVEDQGIPTRRIYFSVLYQQYKILSAQFDSSQNIKFCPQFHTEKINIDSKDRDTFVMQKIHPESVQSSFFPEKIFQSEYSFSDYHKSIYSELMTLCEEGVSENYYKFDNLMTYHAPRMDFHRAGPKSMEALLKIPVFANFYLFRMIQSLAVPYPHNPEEQNLIQISRVHWFEQYVVEAREVRKSLLNNRTVQR